MVKVPDSGKTQLEQIEETKDVSISAANPLAVLETLVHQGDKQLTAHIADLLQKRKDVEAGPASTLLVLETVYGENLSVHFPRPVADADEEKGVNGPHEFFEAPKKDASGNVKMKKCNFFTEFWSDTELGKSQDFQLSQLAHFEKGGDETKAEVKFRNMKPEQRAQLKKNLTNDKSRGRQMIRRAVSVWYIVNDIDKYSNRITLELAVDPEDAEAMASTLYPYDLIDQVKIRNYRPMSIGDITKLDVELAAADAGEKGSLYDALVRQLSRGKAKTTSGNGITNLDELFDTFRNGNLYLDIGTAEGKEHWATLRTMLAKKGSDDLVELLGDYRGNLNAIWSTELDKRYAKIQAKKMEETDAERTAAA